MRIRHLEQLLAVFLLAIASAPIGCRQKSDQGHWEYDAVREIARLLQEYDGFFPGRRVTNAAQLFRDLQRPYPHYLHREFQAFGQHAGFTNSFYEKYVFVPAGITSRFFEGDLVLLNAQPYPETDGSMRRMVVHRTTNGYMIGLLHEETVQKVFKEAGAVIPKFDPMPAPPPAPPAPPVERDLWPDWRSRPRAERIQFLFEEMAHGVGLGRNHWGTMLIATGMVLLLALASLWLWFGRRVRR